MVAAIVVLAVVACAIVLAWRMNYEEDIARFLPHDEQSERWADVYESLSAGGQIAIVVRGDNTDTIEAAMDCLKEQLEQQKHP